MSRNTHITLTERCIILIGITNNKNCQSLNVVIYKGKKPCKSAVKHYHRDLMFTYRKKRTPFLPNKKRSVTTVNCYLTSSSSFYCIKPMLSIWSEQRDLNPRPPGPEPGAIPSYAMSR